MLSPRCWLENIAGCRLSDTKLLDIQLQSKGKGALQYIHLEQWKAGIPHDASKRDRWTNLYTSHHLKAKSTRVPSPAKEYTKQLKTEHWTVIQQGRYHSKDRTKLWAYLGLIWQKQRVRALWQLPLPHRVRMKEKLQNYSGSDDIK